MLRRTALGACVASLFTVASLADEPAPASDLPQFWQPAPTEQAWEIPLPRIEHRLTRLPEFGLSAPQAAQPLLAQRQWAAMPAFEIMEEPLPPPMFLAHPAAFQGRCVAEPVATPAARLRYEPMPAAPAAPPVAAPAVAAPAVAAPYAAAPYPQSFPSTTPAASMLCLPTPTADPVAMVAELFEKLKVSEERGAAARAELAHAQQELAELRTAHPHPSTSTSPAMVMLEMRFLELDLDGVAKLGVDSVGQSGLFALAAGGGLEGCGSCDLAKVASTQVDNFECVKCQQTRPEQLTASSGQPAAETDGIERILASLEKAGLVTCISRPKVMTQSGVAGLIRIGQEIPYTQAQAAEVGAAAQGVAFRMAGVEIEVKPHVLPSGNVRVELRAERSTFDERTVARTGAPTVSRQSIETTMELAAGKTAVVAGLIFERPAPVTSRYYPSTTPGGAMVRFATDSAVAATPQHPESGHVTTVGHVEHASPHGRRELVVLVKPTIVKSVARAAAAERR